MTPTVNRSIHGDTIILSHPSAQFQEQAWEDEAGANAEFEACEAIAAAVPDLEHQIFETYIKLSDLLAQLELNEVRLRTHSGPGRGIMSKLRNSIAFKIDELMKKADRRALRPGIVIQVYSSVTFEPYMGPCMKVGRLNSIDFHNRVLRPKFEQKHRDECHQKQEEAK